MNYFQQALEVMDKQFGKDVARALATCVNDQVSVRKVDCTIKKVISIL